MGDRCVLWRALEEVSKFVETGFNFSRRLDQYRERLIRVGSRSDDYFLVPLSKRRCKLSLGSSILNEP